jgi:integrase
VSIHKRHLAQRDGKGRPVVVYDVKLRDHDGHQYKRTLPTLAAARSFQRDEESKKAKGVRVNPARKTVETVARDWLGKDAVKRDSSKARDLSILRTHVLPVIGSKAIAEVTRSDIQALVSAWTRTHAASSVGRMYSATRALFAFAESDELIGRTPCRDIKLPKADLVARPQLTSEQLSALAGALGVDMDTFMWLGVVLGLRWAEAAGLCVRDIDMLRGRLTVTGQIARDGTRQPPKSAAGARTLSVPAWLAGELAGVMARRGLTGADAGELIFASAEGAPLHYSNWRRRVWVPACERAGVAELRFHDLRSMAATALIAAGTDVKTTQTRMGHSSPQMTLALYARATEQADARAAEAVGAIFRPASAGT